MERIQNSGVDEEPATSASPSQSSPPLGHHVPASPPPHPNSLRDDLPRLVMCWLRQCSGLWESVSVLATHVITEQWTRGMFIVPWWVVNSSPLRFQGGCCDLNTLILWSSSAPRLWTVFYHVKIRSAAWGAIPKHHRVKVIVTPHPRVQWYDAVKLGCISIYARFMDFIVYKIK